MKVLVDLTENKKFNSGIPIYIKNLLANCNQHEYYGGAFAGIGYLTKKTAEQLKDFYHLEKIKIKKFFVPEKTFHRLNFFKFNFGYKKLLENNTDVFLCFNNFLPRNKLKCKNVVVIHDLTPIYSKKMSKLKKRLYYSSYNYTIDKADVIITVSEFSKKDIIDKFPRAKDKIEVVYNGVNYDSFQEKLSMEKIKTSKVKYNLPEQYILFVGQARENKNLVRLMKAYALLPNDIKDKYGLVYANTTEELDGLAKKLNESNIRLLHGIDTEDLVSVYQGASLFTLVSTNEGFGIPLIEAMAAGIPVVCSNVSSLPEIAGDAAVTVDPYSEIKISQTILRILSDDKLKNDLIKKGLERIKQFSWKESAEKFEKILGNIMENKK